MIAASRNPFYPLLLVVSTAFAITAFAYAGLPWDRQPEWLQTHGWQLLLAEVAAVILCGLASMGLDQRRSTIPNASADSATDKAMPSE